MAEVLGYSGIPETAYAIDMGWSIYAYFNIRTCTAWYELLQHPRELPKYHLNKDITEITQRDLEAEQARILRDTGIMPCTQVVLQDVCYNIVSKAIGR